MRASPRTLAFLVLIGSVLATGLAEEAGSGSDALEVSAPTTDHHHSGAPHHESAKAEQDSDDSERVAANLSPSVPVAFVVHEHATAVDSTTLRPQSDHVSAHAARGPPAGHPHA